MRLAKPQAHITKDGNKQTFDCPAPYGFVMDPVIAADAPKELAASGYADLIAKIPAAADWMLADVTGNEAIDEFALNLVQDGLRESLSAPAAVHAGDVEMTEKLSEGLLMSGFAMQAIQSSRPASGTEHQFSHCWDMEDLCFEGKHVSHGFKVGIGTLASTASLEFLLKQDIENLDVEACVAAWKSWDEQEAEICSALSGSCVAFFDTQSKEELDEKLALINEELLDIHLNGEIIDDSVIAELIAGRNLFPVLFGSAL